MIPNLSPYTGIHELLKTLNDKSIPIGIVTSSPSSYCNRIISHWKWNINVTVCYHDTTRKKPDPEPIDLAIKKLGVSKDLIISIGDDPRDIKASKAAGIVSAGALWGAKDPKELMNTAPDYLFHTVEEMTTFLLQ